VLSTLVGPGSVLGSTAETTGATAATTYELGGEVSGWVGDEPSSIDGETNPTLEFTAGERYEIRWRNVDGLPHQLQTLDDDGTVLVESSTLRSGGARTSVLFDATEAMTEYSELQTAIVDWAMGKYTDADIQEIIVVWATG